MARRGYVKFYERLLVGFMALIAIGLAILLVNNFDEHPSVMAFSLIAFTVSAAALLMTTYQSFSIARQLRMMESMIRAVHEAGRDVEQLVSEERQLEREIRQDMKLDKAVVAILEEYGIGVSEKERQAVAKRLASLASDDQII